MKLVKKNILYIPDTILKTKSANIFNGTGPQSSNATSNVDKPNENTVGMRYELITWHLVIHIDSSPTSATVKSNQKIKILGNVILYGLPHPSLHGSNLYPNCFLRY